MNYQPTLIRRGQSIYREGQPAKKVYLLHSGVVSIQVQRSDKTIELAQVVAPQLLGEEALWGAGKWRANAVANNDVSLYEMEVEYAMNLMKKSPALINLFAQSVITKLRAQSEALTELKMQVDPTPCSPSMITKLFATLYHVAHYTGTQKDGKTTVVWQSFRKYCQRVFLESPVRVEQATYILVKLGLAELQMVASETDPNAPPELGYIHFKDLQPLKDFYAFYREHYYANNPDPTSFANGMNLKILQEIEKWNLAGKVELQSEDEEESQQAA